MYSNRKQDIEKTEKSSGRIPNQRSSVCRPGSMENRAFPEHNGDAVQTMSWACNKKQTNAVTGVHTSSNAFGHFPETFFVSPADFHRQNTFSSVCCLEKIKLLSCLTHSVFSHLCR